jgi:hypothetical protein
MRRGERGSVLPFAAVVVLVAGVLVLGVAELGSAVVARAQARTAADAAALAGAAEGRGAADALARANGAELVDFDALGHDVRVTVRWGPARAAARARQRARGPEGQQ